MGRKLCIGVTVIVMILIVVVITVALIFTLRKPAENQPDLSASAVYSNTKEAELMNVNGVHVFGIKDYTGNVQAIHGIQTLKTVYMIDNDLLTQIRSTDYTIQFKYNYTINVFSVMIISKNSSYEIPHVFNTPNVTFPEFEFKLPMDVNISDPFTGIMIKLQDSVSQQLISDAILKLNYYDDQYGNRSAVMINVNGGRYYVPLPTSDAKMEKYFDTEKLYKTLPQQSNSLIELIQAYPMADICSKVPHMDKSFCDEIKEEMNIKIVDSLNTASKYANHIPLRSESSPSTKSHFEIVIHIPGESIIIESLESPSVDDKPFKRSKRSNKSKPIQTDQIDPNILTDFSLKVNTYIGKCNEQTVAGANTPDDRQINIGTGHVAIKFHYETYTVKDQIDVYYTSENIFSSKCVGTEGERVETLRLDDDETNLRVKVTPNCAGGSNTEWYYAIECPSQDLICDGDVCYCGYKKKPSRQVREPGVDGCGTHRLKGIYWWSYRIGEFFSFTPICDQHDRCYGTCNNDKSVCDDSFCTNLRSTCRNTLLQYECQKWAVLFCATVKLLGTNAFINAQNEDCWCDET